MVLAGVYILINQLSSQEKEKDVEKDLLELLSKQQEQVLNLLKDFESLKRKQDSNQAKLIKELNKFNDSLEDLKKQNQAKVKTFNNVGDVITGSINSLKPVVKSGRLVQDFKLNGGESTYLWLDKNQLIFNFSSTLLITPITKNAGFIVQGYSGDDRSEIGVVEYYSSTVKEETAFKIKKDKFARVQNPGLFKISNDNPVHAGFRISHSL